MFKYEKWSVLAAVRFILASIVAINHLGDYTALGWMQFIPWFGAFEAILGFLLISGYSISVSYAKQPDGFVARRILRVYPIYLATLLASYLVFVWLKVPTPPVWLMVVNVLFLNQILTTTSFVGPAWSLALEFWLYCLAPSLMRFSKTLLRWLIFGSFGSFLLYTVLRSLAHLPYYSGVGYGGNLVLLSFVWVAGLRLARAGAEDATAMRDIGLIFVGYIALTVAMQFGFRLKNHAVPTFFSRDLWICLMQGATLLFVFGVFKYVVIPPARPGSARSWFLRLLGDISYPLYLLHAVIYTILLRLKLHSAPLFYLTAVLVSAGVYWVLDFYSKRRHLGQPTAAAGVVRGQPSVEAATPATLPAAISFAAEPSSAMDKKAGTDSSSATA
jgi:peptidoglycan/LPS O-acetylase OafA/YrhL